MASHICFLLLPLLILSCVAAAAATTTVHSAECISAIGDPGMRSDDLRVAFEGWNFCNEVGSEALDMGSPRAADCFHLTNQTLEHRVKESDNKLGVGMPFPGVSSGALHNVDLYAAEKELYLGSLCEVQSNNKPWQFWMVMLKNGNFDTTSGLCPMNGEKIDPFPDTTRRFPCFGKGCMNQPFLYHQKTQYNSETHVMRGWFNGSYDLADTNSEKASFYQVVWEKKEEEGSWVFNHKLKTSKKYPWLMLYLRADATSGFSGGYHYQTRGMMNTLPESPNFKVKLTLEIQNGGGPKSQFYLLDIGSCWKNNGKACDGDVVTDVTRYSEMIINPETPSWCNPKALQNCPPYHIDQYDRVIYRNDTARFPYSAYHYYCVPGNAKHAEKPYSVCDPYSNPQAQELVQILPHPIWEVYGYPTKQGVGWIRDPRTWELDVGGLSGRLYFYQDPGTAPAKRIWTSIDVGTEIFVSDKDEVAEWSLSDFDVLLPKTAGHLDLNLPPKLNHSSLAQHHLV